MALHRGGLDEATPADVGLEGRAQVEVREELHRGRRVAPARLDGDVLVRVEVNPRGLALEHRRVLVPVPEPPRALALLLREGVVLAVPAPPAARGRRGSALLMPSAS